MTTPAKELYRIPFFLWTIIAVGLLLAVGSAYEALIDMVSRWETSEEYGYGYLIPIITLFLIWQRKDKLEVIRFTGSWLGVALLLFGLLILLIGQLSTIFSITQYGFLIAIIGAVYALMGWPAFKNVLVPLLLLFLMVPLPGFLFNNLSSQLQLISSQIGVAFIRLFGVSVYLEGNVIDLGTYKLQVVEACSGLRYLFPLLALSIIASYFYQAAVWKRIAVILSSIPITVLMNSFRIGVIGLLVEYGGPGQAEGFLHDFEGWFVFMACVAILVLEMWLLSKFGRNKNRPFRETFGMDYPKPAAGDLPVLSRAVPKHAFVAVFFLAVTMVSAIILGGRSEYIPERMDFMSFPMSVDGWKGKNISLEPIVLDTLKLDDYLLADYRNADGHMINFYVAYYGSQRSGASAHSPRSCLPGGGWRIESNETVVLGGDKRANRFIISKGDTRQLVYYWFEQRGRNITNEYAVKWYLLWDSLARNRSDGALVRLTTYIVPGEDIAEADRMLTSFTRDVGSLLTNYIPE